MSGTPHDELSGLFANSKWNAPLFLADISSYGITLCCCFLINQLKSQLSTHMYSMSVYALADWNMSVNTPTVGQTESTLLVEFHCDALVM